LPAIGREKRNTARSIVIKTRAAMLIFGTLFFTSLFCRYYLLAIAIFLLFILVTSTIGKKGAYLYAEDNIYKFLKRKSPQTKNSIESFVKQDYEDLKSEDIKELMNELLTTLEAKKIIYTKDNMVYVNENKSSKIT
jgi:hypothetical protein